MSKKHYIKLAKIISKATKMKIDTSYLKVDLINKENFINDLVKYLKEENPKFDEKRFLEACK